MKSSSLRIAILLGLGIIGCRLIAVRSSDLWMGETRWLLDGSALADAPLFGAVLAAWRLGSENAAWLRGLSFLFSAAAALLIFLLARRAFNRLGSLEAGILAASSPLLCAAAWEIHPCALETAATALWLYAFLGLARRNSFGDLTLHTFAAAAATAVNPLTALLAPAQLAVLVAGYGRHRKVILRWLASLAFAGMILLLPVLSGAPAPDDPPPSLTAYDAGFLFTDVSLGGLYSWSPPTPALTFAPSGMEDQAIEGRITGSLEDSFLQWFLQRMQLLMLGLFCMAAVMAGLSIWGISTRGSILGGRTRDIPRRMQHKRIVHGDAGSERDAGLLLILAAVLPVVYALFAGTVSSEPLPDRRLLFVAAPFLALIGRGLMRLQFAPVRYGMVAIVVGLSCLYSFSTVTVKDAAHGLGDAMIPLRQEWRSGDTLAADPVFRGPASWYAGLDSDRMPASESTALRLWRVRFAPRRGSTGAGLDTYLVRCGFGSGLPGGGGGAVFEARFGAVESQKWENGAYILELVVPGPDQDG